MYNTSKARFDLLYGKRRELKTLDGMIEALSNFPAADKKATKAVQRPARNYSRKK
jgi:hypothetical protein